MSKSFQAKTTAGHAPADPVLDDADRDVLCDPYLAALVMTERPEAATPPPRRRAAKGKSARKKPVRTKGAARTGKTAAKKPRQPAKWRERTDPALAGDSGAIPLPSAPEPLATPALEAPPWQGEAAPLPRHHAVTRFHGQGFLAQIRGWLGESLRPASPRSRRRLSPSSQSEQDREIERLKAENAALHRQVEALLALRETERRALAAPPH